MPPENVNKDNRKVMFSNSDAPNESNRTYESMYNINFCLYVYIVVVPCIRLLSQETVVRFTSLTGGNRPILKFLFFFFMRRSAC